MDKAFDEIAEGCPERQDNLCHRKLTEFGIYPWCLEAGCPHWYWLTKWLGKKAE